MCPDGEVEDGDVGYKDLKNGKIFCYLSEVLSMIRLSYNRYILHTLILEVDREIFLKFY